jgi:hypothetical protein
MSDAQRLALLKEVAGTQVYEDRRKESMAILAGAFMRAAAVENRLALAPNCNTPAFAATLLAQCAV